MRSVLLVLGLIAAASAISFSDILREEWNAFKMEHHKHYEELENRFRFKIFIKNKHEIAKHNQKYSTGRVSFKMGLNKYADLSHDEYLEIMNGYNHTADQLLRSSESDSLFLPANVEVPKSKDWRDESAVTGVKDQGYCGSSWAFSAVGALESRHYIKSRVLVTLSEQNLIDCSGIYGNKGCERGHTNSAFEYIKENGGIDTEKSYPYEGKDDYCHFEKSTIGATDRGFKVLPQTEKEKNLKKFVGMTGPISVAIDASHLSFLLYKEGVYDEPECRTRRLTHAMVVIGYGTESGKDYWLVKNSWGTTWGDKGYIKMTRNDHNQCGIATAGSYPIV